MDVINLACYQQHRKIFKLKRFEIKGGGGPWTKCQEAKEQTATTKMLQNIAS